MEQVFGAEVKVDLVAAAAVSAGTAVDGTGVDMQGYDSVAFLVAIATANAGNYLKAMQSDDDGVADSYGDLEGTKIVPATNGDWALLEITKPMKRYVRPTIIRAGANTATEIVWAFRFNKRKSNAVNTLTNTSTFKQVISPAEGTP